MSDAETAGLEAHVLVIGGRYFRPIRPRAPEHLRELVRCVLGLDLDRAPADTEGWIAYATAQAWERGAVGALVATTLHADGRPWSLEDAREIATFLDGLTAPDDRIFLDALLRLTLEGVEMARPDPALYAWWLTTEAA